MSKVGQIQARHTAGFEWLIIYFIENRYINEVDMKRREALTTLGLTSIGMLGTVSSQSFADESNCAPGQSADDGLVDLLFVQEAEGIEFKNGSLTMKGLNPRTLFFSDRPDDIAGFLSYREFIDMVSQGPDNFAEDPPNATLVVLEGETPAEAVLELSEKPQLVNDDLVFNSVKLIQGEPPETGKTAVLFIDTIGRPLSPVSVAGVHRRHRRRRRAVIR